MKADPHQQNKYSIFARMSISWKLFTAATVIIAIIAGFIFYYFPLKLEEKASQELQTKAKTVAKMLAHTVSPALVFEDTASALEALEPALQAQGLEFAVITNHKREFFAGYKPEMGSRLAQEYGPEFSGVTQDGSFFLYNQPILHQDKEIGRLTVGFTLESLLQDVREMRSLIAWISLLIFFLGMAAIYWVTSFVTRPLSRIVEVITAVGKGNLALRAEIHSKDEVGKLANTFNLMLDNLAESTTELQLRELRFRKLAETMNEGLVQLEVNGNILFANAQFFRLFGFSAAQNLVGAHFLSLFETAGQEYLKLKLEFVQKGNPVHEEAELTSIRSVRITVMMSIAPETDHEGNIVRLNALFTNISRLKDTETELRYKNRELDTFVYRASHDLKSPLSSMQGLLKLALTETNDVQARMFLEMILKSADKMQESLLELMEVARTREGQAKMVSLDLEALVTDVHGKLSHMQGSDDITFSHKISPGQMVVADRALLGSALQNLISNAFKYHRATGSDRYILIDFEIGPDCYRISVLDNGPGISEAHQQKLFDMFFRANTGTEGTGLGLYIVKTGIEKMGGTIRVRSMPGEGTAFIIEIPHQQPES